MRVYSATDVGQKRKMNQDYVFVSETPVGNLQNLFVVADGMGGHNAGDYASSHAVQTLVDEIQKDADFNPIKVIRHAIETANTEILESARRDEALRGMGTTMVVATIVGHYLYVANVGDSRLYIIQGKIRQVTKDHSLVEEMIRIGEIKREQEMPIGYCFSYAAESLPDGDARLLHWTKGVHIKEMLGQPVGKPLLDYLNDRNTPGFTSIKVLNDTVASLFAGLTDSSYDAYIGLIVGTGTNMATFIPAEKITKLPSSVQAHGLIPVNLESGNFHPPYLTTVDDTVDACSDSHGMQRFEKAVSGMYLGEILKSTFPLDEFEEKFDAQKLTTIMNYPDIHKDKYVQVAHWIYNRSAQLVAASLAGLVSLLVSYNKDIKKVCLVAEGSMFWSINRKDKDYNVLVMEELEKLLNELGIGDVKVHVNKMNNANLIGTAIAALS